MEGTAYNYIAMWAYDESVSFNNFDCEFYPFCKPGSKHGAGYKGPSQY